MLSWRDVSAPRREPLRGSPGDAPGERAAPTIPFGEQLGPDGRPPLPGLEEQDAVVRDVMLARIGRRDPGFGTPAFVRGAVEAFLAVERAWSDLDPQRSRRYLSGPLWSSHRARMELYALHGRRNRLDGLQVRHAEIVGARTGDGPERVTVRVTARSGDCDVDAAGRILRGDTKPRDWQEDWTFQRAAGATTPAGGGVLAERCPNCSAPLAVDGEGVCTTCHAPVLDGSRDWVVVAVARVAEERSRVRALLGVGTTTVLDRDGREQVVQTVEPIADAGPAVSRQPQHDPAALALLSAIDAPFIPAELVEHVTAAFVAVRRAWAGMDPERVRPYMDEATAAAFATTVAAERAAGHHHLADDPLVDEVDVVSAVDGDGFVTVVCRVLADLQDAVLDAAGTVVSGSVDVRTLACALTLRRHAGARSPGTGVSVLRCPRCGAPLRATVLEPCPFCREAVAGGGGEWALVAVGALEEVAPEVAAPVAPPDTAGAAGSVLAPLGAADPGFNEHELEAAARESFYAVETSTARLDAAAARPCLTDSLFTEHAARIEQLRGEHRHHLLAFLEVGTVTPLSAATAGAQRATLRLDISGQDLLRDDVTGTVVGGSEEIHRWQEDWTLTRTGPGAPWLVAAVAPARLP